MQDTRHTSQLKRENHIFAMKNNYLCFRRFKTINPNMDINMMISVYNENA